MAAASSADAAPLATSAVPGACADVSAELTQSGATSSAAGAGAAASSAAGAATDAGGAGSSSLLEASVAEPAVEKPGGEVAPIEEEALLSKGEQRRRRKARLKLEMRDAHREKAREKRCRQKQRRQEARKELLNSLPEEERAGFLAREKAEAQARLDEERAALQRAYDSGRPRVVINCSFGDQMFPKELMSLAKQVRLSYNVLRELRAPLQLHVTSLGAENPVLPCLSLMHHAKWKVHFHEESIYDLFKLDELVVLSPDADEDLDMVYEDRVYVLGGLVDRSVQKMQTRGQAEDRDVGCVRRLPVKRFGPAGMHSVFNIDVVVRMLAERLRGRAWPDILRDCLPQRHLGGTTRRARRNERRRERGQAAAGAADGAADESSSADGSSSEGLGGSRRRSRSRSRGADNGEGCTEGCSSAAASTMA
eukprot:TRINITY_DN6678_c0_g1_i2.p1 TRINITY_DN6678_c0_g1~~TRINITY_DN6678_c0_g1_i2.p1  ORF type:complete len:423 (+),score=125.73 TRINITY_DN6678_c0_g1_i2:90-1358(+)